MSISNCRLPEIELPTLKILDDDDKKVIAAFEILLNGYKKAQERTRAVVDAYNELKTITLSILKNDNDNETSTRRENDRAVAERISITIPKTSTPNVQTCRSRAIARRAKQTDGGTRSDGKISSVRVANDEQNVGEKKNVSSSRTKFPQNDFEQKLYTESSMATSKMAKASKERKSLDASVDNEENQFPLDDKSSNRRSDASRREQHESHPTKLGLTTAIYNVESRKASDRKSLKQSTLVFQPIATNIDLTQSEKQNIGKPDIVRHWDNLFDEDYRTKNKSCSPLKEQNNRANGKNLAKTCDEPVASTSAVNKFDNSTPMGNNKAKMIIQEETKSMKKVETTLYIPTASQINETACSLFDDEEHDNFLASPDIMNTCANSSTWVAEILQSPKDCDVKKKLNKRSEPPTAIAPNTSGQFADSDETFFAPAEAIAAKRNTENEKIPAADAIEIIEIRNSRDKDNSFERKFTDKSRIDDTNDEFEDLALQDVNWDSEPFDEDRLSSKRPRRDSFHIPPKKTKNSPKYAYKDKVERNKEKRKKLGGWDCWECEKYYKNLNLPEKELKKRMDACSRHRSKYNPRYYTPKNFWDPEFPEMTDSSDSDKN